MDKKFVPKFRKPEAMCFWCQGNLTDDDLEGMTTEFSRYYAKCEKCRAKQTPRQPISIIEAVDFPLLIDQPMYNGSYPTGGLMYTKKGVLDDFIKGATEGTISDLTDSEEIMMSPPLFSILVEWAMNSTD